MIKKTKGIALIAAIMLIVFISTAVLGITTFIVQWFAQLNADQISAKCLYLAHAGIQDAIYEVRSTYNPDTTNGSFTLGLATVDTGETYRRGGTAADLLMVDTSDTSQDSQDLEGLEIQKATSSVSPAVAIDRMLVTWVKSGTSRNLRSIRFNGSNVWTGNLSSPANANLSPNYTLNTAPTTISVDRLRFSGSMSGLSSMSIQFVMTDGSTKTAVVYPASNNCIFTINSTGKVSGSNIYRTIKADYNLMPATYATTSRINDIDELNTEIASP
jgi:hypothetical protein